MNDIHALMAQLSNQRPLFHSEADFQHAFAWLLHEQWPQAKIRLEYPIEHNSKYRYIDIVVQNGDKRLAIELKYKTAKIAVDIDGEPYRLKDQSAHDLGRNGYLQDVERLEQFVTGTKKATGWAILLTNDSGYRNQGRRQYPNDTDFRLHNGRELSGTLHWYRGAKNETINDDEEPIHLQGSYTMSWCDYAQLPVSRYAQMCYLALEIKS